MRGPQVLARLDAATGTAQPLAVEEVCSTKLHAGALPVEQRDRFSMEALGVIAVAEQSSRTCFQAECPVGAAERRPGRQTVEGCRGLHRFAGPDGCLHELRQ